MAGGVCATCAFNIAVRGPIDEAKYKDAVAICGNVTAPVFADPLGEADVTKTCEFHVAEPAPVGIVPEADVVVKTRGRIPRTIAGTRPQREGENDNTYANRKRQYGAYRDGFEEAIALCAAAFPETEELTEVVVPLDMAAWEQSKENRP